MNFYVAKFYLRQKKYHAALSRFEELTRAYPNVGLDYKVEYYINETKAKIAEEEKLRLKRIEKQRRKEERRTKEEEKKASKK